MNVRHSILIGAVMLASVVPAVAPAFAQGDTVAAANQTVYDADGKRIAKVTRVLEDGSVLIIYKGKVVRLGADTLTVDEDKLATSLSRREISRLD